MGKKIKVAIEVDLDELKKHIESSSKGMLKVDRKKLETHLKSGAIQSTNATVMTFMTSYPTPPKSSAPKR